MATGRGEQQCTLCFLLGRRGDCPGLCWDQPVKGLVGAFEPNIPAYSYLSGTEQPVQGKPAIRPSAPPCSRPGSRVHELSRPERAPAFDLGEYSSYIAVFTGPHGAQAAPRFTTSGSFLPPPQQRLEVYRYDRRLVGPRLEHLPRMPQPPVQTLPVVTAEPAVHR